MSYQAEHLGLWFAQVGGFTSTQTTITFSDGTNTFTTAGANKKLNIVAIYYEIVTSTNGQIVVAESGASNNTFATIGGTGQDSTSGYREIKFPGRGYPCANENRGVTLTVSGTILANIVVVATVEKTS